MPKYGSYDPITRAYPTLANVPNDAELLLKTTNPTTNLPAEYNVTPAELSVIMGAATVNVDIGDGTISNAKLTNMAPSTIKGRAANTGTGDPVDLTAEEVLEILGIEPEALVALTDAEVAAQYSDIAADTDLNVTLGDDNLTALEALFADDDDAFYARLDALGILYARTAISEGQLVLGNVDSTTEVAGTSGVNLAADPYAMTSSSNALAINFNDGNGPFRTVTTSEAFKLTPSNVPTFYSVRVQITAGGSHTVTWVTGARVVPSTYASGIALTSGQRTMVKIHYDGSTYTIEVGAPSGTAP
jgi:hypothetical protein